MKLLDDADPRVPDADACSIAGLLHRGAVERPGDLCAAFPDGTTWTWADIWEVARRSAVGLRERGVSPGDRVLGWLPNGPEALSAWFGANLLNATYVPVNTALRGATLEHVVATTKPEVVIVHSALMPEWQLLNDRPTTVVVGDHPDAGPLGSAAWYGESGRYEQMAAELGPAQPWDRMLIIFTSGTTGRAKGVSLTYANHYTAVAGSFLQIARPGDRYLVNLPLFHVGGTLGVYSMLLGGLSFAIVDAFNAHTFWDDLESTGANCVTLLGSMVDLLLDREDGSHGNSRLRWAWVIPVNARLTEFRDRFGVEAHTLYSMTEIPLPVVSGRNPDQPGLCGRVREGFEARIVDENDQFVVAGEVGELVIRAGRPWSIAHEYFNHAEASARAWRNGWFHTGDAFRCDAAGNLFFVDRLKDTIRRRGENISSFEVEVEVVAHPAVREVAAYPARDELGGEEVMVAVTSDVDGDFPFVDLIEFLSSRLPHHMIPRYVRVLEALPKTHTNRVMKHRLREEGVAAGTWDREAAGMVFKRRAFR